MKQRCLVLLALCLLLSTLWGCKKHDPAPAVTATPGPTVTPGGQTIVDVPGDDDQPETKDELINGEEVTMTLVSGSFQRLGGPDFSLYVEKDRYTVNDVDGCCYITTDEGNTYAEIGFRGDTDAESLSSGFLREYGNMQDSSDAGDETFSAYTARRLSGRTMDSAFEAYLIDVEGGCVTLVVCSPLSDASPINSVMPEAARLIQSLKTITLS